MATWRVVVSIGDMAKYELHEDAATVAIEVSGVGDDLEEQKLLEAFDDCRSGRCSCPTDQYDKLASMDVDRADDSITLRLDPSPAPVRHHRASNLPGAHNRQGPGPSVAIAGPCIVGSRALAGWVG